MKTLLKMAADGQPSNLIVMRNGLKDPSWYPERWDEVMRAETGKGFIKRRRFPHLPTEQPLCKSNPSDKLEDATAVCAPPPRFMMMFVP